MEVYQTFRRSVYVRHFAKWAFDEMEGRLSGLAEDSRRKCPKIVVFVDEYADLMDYDSKKTAAFKNIVGLSKAENAVGIHIVISTNRVSSGVITKEIKSKECRARSSPLMNVCRLKPMNEGERIYFAAFMGINLH